MEELDLASKSIEELEVLLEEYQTIQVQENLNQLVKKTLINSVYGAIGNAHFPLYNPDIADCITSIGRYNIKVIGEYVIDKINEKSGEEVCYRSLTDTDSFFICFSRLIEKLNIPKEEAIEFLDQLDKKVIQGLIQEIADDIFYLQNDFKLTYEMDREKLGHQIVTGKKKYAVELHDNEGKRLNEPKYVATGLEIKRSSTPAIIRKKLLEFVKMMFKENNESILKEMDSFKNEYMSKEIYSIDDIAIPTGVNDLEKYIGVTSSVPMHVRASLVHNRVIEEKGLSDFQPISSGDKIKYVHLKLPNFTGNNVIAFNDYRFLQVTGLDKMIDYKAMYEKTFVSPLENLMTNIGWSMNSSASTMNSLF